MKCPSIFLIETIQMKLLSLLTAAIFLSNGLLAQTKVIAHKSISGSNASFANAYIKGASELDGSNFGEFVIRDMPKKVARLDTVVYLSNTESIMVTTCIGENRYSFWWRPGSDTVYNHELFGKKHSLDSIKEVLKTQYHFANDIDSVVFIGYDNQGYNHLHQNKKHKKNASPFVGGPGNSQPPFGHPFAALFLLAALSVLVGFLKFRLPFKRVSAVS